MSDVPFHMTIMGHRFYEATAPSIVRELARLNENLERLVAVLERREAVAGVAKPVTELKEKR